MVVAAEKASFRQKSYFSHQPIWVHYVCESTAVSLKYKYLYIKNFNISITHF